jgi:hypothetical protein
VVRPPGLTDDEWAREENAVEASVSPPVRLSPAVLNGLAALDARIVGQKGAMARFADLADALAASARASEQAGIAAARRVDEVRRRQREARLRLIRVAARVEAAVSPRAPEAPDREVRARASVEELQRLLAPEKGLRERLDQLHLIQRLRGDAAAAAAAAGAGAGAGAGAAGAGGAGGAGDALEPGDLRQLLRQLDEHAQSIEELLAVVRRHAGTVREVEARAHAEQRRLLQ